MIIKTSICTSKEQNENESGWKDKCKSWKQVVRDLEENMSLSKINLMNPGIAVECWEKTRSFHASIGNMPILSARFNQIKSNISSV